MFKKIISKIRNWHIEQKIRRICADVKDVEKTLVKAGFNRDHRKKYWRELIRIIK